MTQTEKFTETEIVERVINGEKSLYEIIVRRFNPYLYKVGRSYNYNHEDTQDLMQETFVDAYKSLKQFEGRSDFKTWLVRIMLNNCYHKKEKSSFKNEISQDLNINSNPMFTNSNNDTEKVIQNRELGHILEDALSEIPLDYRVVFSLREINGFNVAETANLLNITEANVKTRLSRSKSMLRNEIEKTYSTAELFEFNLIYCDAIVENVMKRINEL
ncbi:MAG: sigma-70 family RNA polymerase sigma factor [Bacteroidetes bacterium]|nr:sigma-70 family RNA polymerase sigma factor [Bacteroidota bacterium]MBP7399019.1 sigma-70 family RNA polymerase sigma factor [Chitinophagales bacterium]MBK7107666.1 sigma-70 family RNA polymerase sigma factor [Bacteroidota bacterium]MBK8486902.1 sigma-70 family RNA polymerase sigma factor [Bacteroidota bacterium]MBK8681200.1 sigma-70 family RNA polymerase sigma factor [Bacteroidota bacterium]